MKKILIVGIGIFVFLSLSRIGFSQQTEEEKRIEETKRQSLEKTEERVLRQEKNFYLDHGGWLSTNFTWNHNDDNNQDKGDLIGKSQDIDLRSWFRGSFLRVLEDRPNNDIYFYLRFKNKLIYREPADATRNVYASEHHGTRLDMGYFNLDLKPAFNLKAGRQFMRLGRGITYNAVHDGIEVSSSYSKFEGRAFISKTPEHEDNIDYSVPGYDRGSDRKFAGVEASWLTIPNHRPYAYILIENDDSKEDPDDTSHEYKYDANYLGLGSRGQLVKDMRYWLELICETGHSYRYDNTSSRASIKAWAWDSGLSYYWNVDTHPVFSLEYAYGSGDNDRQNVTNTLNGNLNSKDSNFLYFGYYGGGYALSPRLSNINVFGLGASFKPLEKINKELGDVQLGTKWYLYRKDKKEGGISDTDATSASNDLGYELDVFANWRIFSDLIWSLQYGQFSPGKAYPNRDNEDYLYTNLVLSF